MPTPMISSLRLLSSGAEAFEDSKLFRTMVCSLQYLTITCLDLSFAVNKLSQFMHARLLPHRKAAKRILRYLQGTKEFGLTFHRCNDTRLYAFSDSDWAADIEDRRKQSTISRSSTEAEFKSLASCETDSAYAQPNLA
ncbi:uncharacterized mitochondrial protein AtMg00240-like [Arachis stenosperma]|uniref:uncharacterized mitochondrial protein AtMg00240-like n=1 Tax=Arachis stenosperma TaxID=217475 RepID=UPI0025AD119D|nr:uncharacterized mitochondrial protein AtMg00240-like [Arachis stenosperma]